MPLSFEGAIRYRMRPADVLAVQWTGDNAAQLRAFAGDRFDTIDPEDRTEDPAATAQLRESTHNTWRPVTPGMWIVKSTAGFAVWQDELFNNWYEPVGVGAQKCRCGHSGLVHTVPTPHSCFTPDGCPCEAFASADPAE